MHTNSRLFRLTATSAIVGMALGPLLPQAGFAQSAASPLAAPSPLAPPAVSLAPSPQTTADPPARVGRLSRVVGQVSFHGLGADHWDVASLNFPVTSGDSFWTQPAASADLGVTSNRMTMDQSTELDVATLDDHSLVASIPRGQIYLRLLALAPGETYTITTPRGTVAMTAPGRYAISAGDTESPTRVTVVAGAAQISGSNLNLQVAPNQTALITGTDPFETQVVPAQRDAFLTAQLARERPPSIGGGITAPAEVVQMTGAEDLTQYGTWQQSPQYGTVWYPQVAAGYVPYRNGHWAYVAPWGWTWIDAAPWGFAPFHYGRWVQYGGRWGWVPGGGVAVYGSPGYIAPVYAPALVAFFGIGIGVGIGLAGGFGGNVGWAPLGWQEPYHPWYGASANYTRNVNSTYVRNVTNITTVNTTTINNYANRGAATIVPASAMAASRPINQVGQPVAAAQLAQAHPLIGQQPIAPTAATAGVTPRVAQEMHLAAPPAGADPATRLAAPGPAIHAEATPSARPALSGAAPVAHDPGTPNAAAIPHAPGPPIGSHAAGVAPNATPALAAPAEAPRPRAPGAVAGTSSGTPAHPHPQAVAPPPGPVAQPRVNEAAQPRAVPQNHPAPVPAPFPQAPAPQVHNAQRSAPAPVQAPHPQAPAPQVHNAQHSAPAPAPHPQAPAPEHHQKESSGERAPRHA